jgi:hypothetical protein
MTKEREFYEPGTSPQEIQKVLERAFRERAEAEEKLPKKKFAPGEGLEEVIGNDSHLDLDPPTSK